MQPADNPPGDFHRHFVDAVIAPDTQPHIMAAQPAVRRLVVDVQQLRCRDPLFGQGVEVLTKRLNAFGVHDKL